ncbi:MAG: sulfatase-like hydrolase/transferase [Candidatus Aminicenantes bacterium]
MRKTIIFIGALTGAAVAGIILFLIFRPEKEPQREFSRLISDQGIEKPNIIFITLDTTRSDHLPCYGYTKVKTPHLDSLARKGMVFEQCTASSPLTLPSHASMMTGLYPTYHGVRVNGNTALSGQHLTLAELLAGQGYQCGAFIGAFVLDGRWGLKQGFHHYDDQFDLKKYKKLDLAMVQRPGNEVVDAALAWLEKNKKDPFFAWIHLYDPHAPYQPPEPYLSQYNTGLVGLYDGEIAFTDEQIGRCVSWLDQNELDKSTIVVIMGDHGEGLGDHGELAHGYYVYDYAVQVPFLVITPFERFQHIRISGQVRTVDVYPTLLEMVGISVPEENQGQSLISFMFHPEKEKGFYAYSESLSPNIHYGWSPLHSLRSSRYKYIAAPRDELYDLQEDPEEENNIKGKLPKMAQKMKNTLEEVIQQTSREAPQPEAANLDTETLERLAALGYIGAPVSRKSASKGGEFLADPKDKLHIYESVQKAGELINHEEYGQGAKILESVLEEEPSIPQALLLLATCYVESGKMEEAKHQFDLILKDDPHSVQALIGMANLLMGEGQTDDVVALCQQTLAVDEMNTQAYTLLGEVHMAEDNHEQALPYLKKAVEIQPKLTRNRLNLAACLVGLGNYHEAEVILEDILSQYPKFPLVHYHMALLYEEQGELEKARELYTQEIQLYPENFRARFNLGKLLFKFGDRKGYLEQMREVIRIAPRKAEGYLFLARGLLYESIPIDQILELVQKGLVLAEKPELKAFAYFLLADIYDRKKQPDKVKEALRKANDYKSK